MLTRWLLSEIGAMLGLASYAFGVRRKVIVENLREAYPEWSDSEIRKTAMACARNLGRVFLEMLYLRYARQASVKKGLTYTNIDLLQQAHREGKGVVLLSGHLGNWEWLALATGIHAGIPLRLVVKNQRTGLVERFLQTMRTRLGNGLVDAGDVRGIFRALDRGEILGILGDQTAFPESTTVTFFGREVPAFEGPARLALRSRSPIILLETWRESGEYFATCHNVDYSDINGTGPDAVAALTKRHTALLEAIIRKRPELWLWQHKRWKHAKPR